MARLTGINVLVTGAESNLGRSTCRRLIGEGAQLIATVLDERGAAMVERDLGTRGRVHLLDVTSAEAWDSLADTLRAEQPTVHGLVNHAFRVGAGSLVGVAADDLRAVLEVNLLGPALGIRAIAPLIAASGGGSIVNIASTAALRGENDAAIYSSTSWGLRGLTRSTALELGPQGIRVNTVCPSIGLVRRPAGSVEPVESVGRTVDALAGAERAVLRDGDARRAATAGDVAAMVAFLLSDDSATCTGGDFLVDAGEIAGTG